MLLEQAKEMLMLAKQELHSAQGAEISAVGNGTSFQGAETKPIKGTVKNVCPLCADPSHL